MVSGPRAIQPPSSLHAKGACVSRSRAQPGRGGVRAGDEGLLARLVLAGFVAGRLVAHAQIRDRGRRRALDEETESLLGQQQRSRVLRNAKPRRALPDAVALPQR